MTVKNNSAKAPADAVIHISGDQLFVLLHAADFLIASHKRLHWELVALMGHDKGEMKQQLKMISRLEDEVSKIEDAKSAACRVFESQFNITGNELMRDASSAE